MVKDPELERLRIQIVEIGIKTLSFIIRRTSPKNYECIIKFNS